MTFFNKKQDVIDIKLTQFGKNLLARGFFKPFYYRFFDDDILYNSSCAGFQEEQNDSEKRILNSQRPRTQHTSVSVEELFDLQENLINSGSIKTFMEIKRRQDPFISEKLLKYPLQDTIVNNSSSPIFNVTLLDVTASNHESALKVKGVTLPVPQLNLTSSYTLVRDIRREIEESKIPIEIRNGYNYLDITGNKIDFLDKSCLYVEKNDVVIHLEEMNTYDLNENFEIEFYEIEDSGDEEFLIRLSKEQIEKYFSITIDEEVSKQNAFDIRNPRFKNTRDDF
tara:strand:- start:1967 stop:2812 length:846 start_codon:yes stop_codon:yes gene_type:complete